MPFCVLEPYLLERTKTGVKSFLSKPSRSGDPARKPEGEPKRECIGERGEEGQVIKARSEAVLHE